MFVSLAVAEVRLAATLAPDIDVAGFRFRGLGAGGSP
jgi:hypothetical protein